MGKKASERPILGGPYILVYDLGKEMPGDLPNEIFFRHPTTKARAVYVLKSDTVVVDGAAVANLDALPSR